MGKVVVVGSINVDLVFTSCMRPKSGETVLGNTFDVIPGGKGANQAVAASKLNTKVCMIGCVGNDANGELSVKNFEDTGINTHCIGKVENISTGVANIVVAQGDNSIIVVPGANFSIDISMINKYRDIIASAEIVLVQLEIPMDVVEYTVDICKENNVPVILNPAPAIKLKKTLIDNATYITPNEHECKIIFGLDKDSDIESVMRQYPNKLLITVGARGVEYFDGDEIKNIQAYKVDVVDTTGAGDTFNGGLAAALVKGYKLDEAIQFANKAASLSVTKLGAQSGMPTVEDLKYFDIR